MSAVFTFELQPSSNVTAVFKKDWEFPLMFRMFAWTFDPSVPNIWLGNMGYLNRPDEVRDLIFNTRVAGGFTDANFKILYCIDDPILNLIPSFSRAQ